jgi:two-component system sensor histidine kinase KdpD
MAATALCHWIRRPGDPVLPIAAFLLLALGTAAVWGGAVSGVVCLESLLLYDFFLESPAFSLAVHDWPVFLAFAAILVSAQAAALVVDRLRDRVREAVELHRTALDAERERLRGDLLSALGHDLRTPLSSITAAVSGLRSGASMTESDRKAYLDLVAEESGRMHEMVENLLELSRFHTGILRAAKEWQPLEEVVGSAVRRFSAHHPDSRVEIDLPDDLPLVPLDAVLVEQVILNLLENARRHGGRTESVCIQARMAPGGVEVAVSDRGPGIPDDRLEAIFARFARLDGGAEGLGLGLAVCRAILEVHEGWIRAERRSGGGAVFRFHLPVPDGAPVHPEASG